MGCCLHYTRKSQNCCWDSRRAWKCNRKTWWFPLVDVPYGCGWQHHGWEWTWETVEHCACVFICVTHGHRSRILPCTQSTLSDPRSVGHNPPEDLKMYLTTHAKAVFVKFITAFWEVLTVVAEILDNIPRICDHRRSWGFSTWRKSSDLSSAQKEQGTGIFIYMLSYRCCPYLHAAAHLA